MDLLSAIILGAVQGLTEFLPVSSTGHLILARELLGLETEFSLAIDAVLHLATAGAVLIYFRSDFLNLLAVGWQWVFGGSKTTNAVSYEGEIGSDVRRDRYLLLALIFGTLPAVALGLLFEEELATVVRSADLVAGALVIGSLIFLLAEYVGKRNVHRDVTPRMGFRIGFFQALALMPGMSRSGMAISGGLLLGLTREQAARFAFLLSFPVILGAGGLSALQLGVEGVLTEMGLSLIAAALAAFITGWLAIHYLLKYLRTHTLGIFVVYRVALALVIFLMI
jgi:undecaprenyl-diphosphatase